MEDSSFDPGIIAWEELLLPGDEPCEEWDAYFQPMIQAPDHAQSVWAKIPDRPRAVLLVTLWYSTPAMRSFRDSPSVQLFWESLSAKGIKSIASYESSYVGNWFERLSDSYVQLFRIYFEAPVDDDRRAQISKLRGMKPAALGPSMPRKYYIQNARPCQIWTTQTESIQGKHAQLMFWPHFWANAEKAEWRHTETFILSGSVAVGKQTIVEKFIDSIKEADPIEWREAFYKFKKIQRCV